MLISQMVVQAESFWHDIFCVAGCYTELCSSTVVRSSV